METAFVAQPRNKRRRTQSSSSSSSVSHVVHLVPSAASLLSGKSLTDCQHSEDPTCIGGIATTAALARYHSRQYRLDHKNDDDAGNPDDDENENDESVLLLPFLDSRSPFVQMSPIGWSVNRLLFEYVLQCPAFLAPPSLLLQNKNDHPGGSLRSNSVSQRDISDLQSFHLPLLLSNVAIPLENSWNRFHTPILQHTETGLAVLLLHNSQQAMNTPQIGTVWGALDYIARINQQQQCQTSSSSSAQSNNNSTSNTPFLDQVQILLESNPEIRITNNNDDFSMRTRTNTTNPCWIPVILYADVKANLQALLDAVVDHPHPPALIVDLEAHLPPLNTPRPLILPSSKNTTSTGDTNRNATTWFVSLALKDDLYHHHVITLNEDRTGIADIQLIHHELNVDAVNDPNSTTPSNNNTNSTNIVRDQQYNTTIDILADLARQAQIHDPIVAYSYPMPVQRQDNYRRCKSGPCESAILYLDALQWYTQTDVAFGNSGGYRGSGWGNGIIQEQNNNPSMNVVPVRVSNIWELLPFPNNICTGVMSGVSLFRMFQYSLSMATFEGHNTQTGDLLLQISYGMRLTYNTQRNSTDTRLVQMELWNATQQEYVPIERLRLYRYATDSFMCTGHPLYKSYYTNITFPGEEPGSIDPTILQQEVVVEYLRSQYPIHQYQTENNNHTNATDPGNMAVYYRPTTEGRMFNDTGATTVLNLVQSPLSCSSGAYWNPRLLTCFACPSVSKNNNRTDGATSQRTNSGIVFLQELLKFQGQTVPESLPSEAEARQQEHSQSKKTKNSNHMASSRRTASTTIAFVNTLSRNVTVIIRSLPFWVRVAPHDHNNANNHSLWDDENEFHSTISNTSSIAEIDDNNNTSMFVLFENLAAGQEGTLHVTVDFRGLQPGTVMGTAIFGVVFPMSNQYIQEDPTTLVGPISASSFAEERCPRPDATFDLMVHVYQPEQLNQLGPIRYFGWSAAGLVIFICIFLVSWVVWKRKTRVVRTLQPLFLVTITLGVLVLGSALIPLGMDDEIASNDICDRACMSFPWLLSMGFTVAMSALFSKLWRINKLFQNNSTVLRKIQVKERDVLAPFAILFLMNFAALLVWTIVDPLRWQRVPVEGSFGQRQQGRINNNNTADEDAFLMQNSNASVGVCRAQGDGVVSTAMVVIVGVVNLFAFGVACYQAFRARHVSDEFSESKRLGIALCSWFQLLFMGVPVLFLINVDENPSARYFITAGFILAVCLSMLGSIFYSIFAPLFSPRRSIRRQHYLEQEHQSYNQFSMDFVGTTRISGFPLPNASSIVDDEDDFLHQSHRYPHHRHHRYHLPHSGSIVRTAVPDNSNNNTVSSCSSSSFVHGTGAAVTASTNDGEQPSSTEIDIESSLAPNADECKHSEIFHTAGGGQYHYDDDDDSSDDDRNHHLTPIEEDDDDDNESNGYGSGGECKNGGDLFQVAGGTDNDDDNDGNLLTPPASSSPIPSSFALQEPEQDPSMPSRQDDNRTAEPPQNVGSSDNQRVRNSPVVESGGTLDDGSPTVVLGEPDAENNNKNNNNSVIDNKECWRFH